MNGIKNIFGEKGIKQARLAESLGENHNLVEGNAKNRQQQRPNKLFGKANILDIQANGLLKSELANKLKVLLDNMSQNEFDAQWSEITALGLKGPSFSDVFEYDAINFQVEYELSTPLNTSYKPNHNPFNLAA